MLAKAVMKEVPKMIINASIVKTDIIQWKRELI
jgi:hypothetical protein